MNINKITAKLFADTEASFALERINQITGFLLGVFLLGIFNNIPEQQANATVFFIMLIVWGFMSVIETVGRKKTRSSIIIYGLGKNFMIAIIAGAIIGFLLQMTSQSIVPTFTSISVQNLGLIFVGIVAPFVEANFFRGLIMGTIYEYLGFIGLPPIARGFIALTGQALGFAWFHTNVILGTTGGALIPSNPLVLLPYFIFGIIAGIGVLIFKSIGFEYGLHGTNNLLWLFINGGL